MTVAQKLPILDIQVTKPTLLPRPEQKWRVLARLKVWSRNKAENERAEHEYLSAARMYETKAEKWGNAGHQLRAALLLEKAAACSEKT